jgi:16S rRNA (adenine1518-N6/adenine1519-N6)-dimethyltransferase
MNQQRLRRERERGWGPASTKKRFGQHFLEPAWADKVIGAIAPQPTDRFLEIGPGPGALTMRLAPLVQHLTAVEIDRDLVAALAARLAANVTLIEADFLELDLRILRESAPLRVAGNLPYNVSTPILFRLLAAHRDQALLIDATLMLQREVAERLRAHPGTKDYGVLSILVQLHADVTPLLLLPPGAFRPVPKVHSAVVRLRFRPPAVPLPDEPLFQDMVRSMFTQRRKMVGNALAAFATARGQRSVDMLRRASIDPARRPETLQLAELSRLAEVFVSE